jgi:GTP-binding protein
MLPVVVIVGRPNVGKSTFFNRLTKKRSAIVDDIPGITRDRLYATAEWDGRSLVLVDTGGFDTSQDGTIMDGVKKQVEMAIEEADLIILLFDGRAGPMVDDEELLMLLRRSEKKVAYVVNKIDGPEQERLSFDFYSLGMDKVFPISSAHGYGIASLMEQVIKDLPAIGEPEEEEGRIKVAIIGRPNVGKSSLINRVIGSERLVVSELPGTTRDSVDISFAGVYDQDAKICGYALESGCGIVMAFNKWDLIKNNPSLIRSLEDSVDRQLAFVSFVPKANISALTGERVRKLFDLIDTVWAQYNVRVPTPAINRVLGDVVERYPPPSVGGRRAKFLYATQVSVRPPAFVIFGNRLNSIRGSYERYLVNQFKQHFGLNLIPIRISLRER